MRFCTLLLVFAGLFGGQAAQAAGTETFTPTMTGTDTPTATASPTFTASPTVTVSPTVTPGAGNWSLSIPNPLIYGGSGNTAIWTYTAAQPFSGGLLAFQLPDGLEAPSASNFYVQPSQGSQVSGPIYSGQSVTFTVNSLAAGSSLAFWYGYNATGFAVNTTITPLGPFTLWAHPSSVTLGAGVVTPVPAPAAIAIITRTATPTVTPTATITVTHSATPTITESHTVTQTYTETPLAAAPADGVFSYPNPFDLRRFDKTTFRFAPTASAQITVFNLVGEPVRRLDDAEVQAAQGWAIWPGVDDYGRKVTGGIYFVRVVTPQGVHKRKFTVLH
jgi:hypothetical protein